MEWTGETQSFLLFNKTVSDDLDNVEHLSGHRVYTVYRCVYNVCYDGHGCTSMAGKVTGNVTQFSYAVLLT